MLLQGGETIQDSDLRFIPEAMMIMELLISENLHHLNGVWGYWKGVLMQGP